MAEPTLLTFTVMKNEGPFILEWVAWQRLMGMDSIVMLNWRETDYDFLTDVVDFVDEPVTDLCNHSSSATPGKWRRQRGFKSMSRKNPHIAFTNRGLIAKLKEGPLFGKLLQLAGLAPADA